MIDPFEYNTVFEHHGKYIVIASNMCVELSQEQFDGIASQLYDQNV